MLEDFMSIKPIDPIPEKIKLMNAAKAAAKAKAVKVKDEKDHICF